ncbi:AAA family ATPase [Robertkochia sediminum]|uniref:AAA family ATPase n=1 Tax=Robertkochia sediminum TaxID=2785326 RepID=UPI001933E72F|nr:ATP-binding protein [Robertkochia sediminum]MBL7473927.1 ATP-binding protein [Robertkochia sediminum]
MEEKLKQKSGNLVKVVLYGPESTGKTTLAKRLAEHYKTAWVPEFARDYLQEKWDREQKACERKDMIPIAVGQMESENELAKEADTVLILDTNLLVTMVYSEAYYDGYVDPLLEKYALESQYDLYLLTYIDTPWEPDDLRDRPDRREEMFDYFLNTLDTHGLPYEILKGDKEERFIKATNLIDKLIAHDPTTKRRSKANKE